MLSRRLSLLCQLVFASLFLSLSTLSASEIERIEVDLLSVSSSDLQRAVSAGHVAEEQLRSLDQKRAELAAHDASKNTAFDWVLIGLRFVAVSGAVSYGSYEIAGLSLPESLALSVAPAAMSAVIQAKHGHLVRWLSKDFFKPNEDQKMKLLQKIFGIRKDGAVGRLTEKTGNFAAPWVREYTLGVTYLALAQLWAFGGDHVFHMLGIGDVTEPPLRVEMFQTQGLALLTEGVALIAIAKGTDWLVKNFPTKESLSWRWSKLLAVGMSGISTTGAILTMREIEAGNHILYALGAAGWVSLGAITLASKNETANAIAKKTLSTIAKPLMALASACSLRSSRKAH